MSEGWIEVRHDKLGALRVPAQEVLRFDGIPGFPEARRFALLVHDRADDVAWLACLDDPGLALPVVDLRALRPDVGDALTPADLAAVSAEDASQVDLLGIVNMRYSPPRLNLDAPLLVHARTRRGVQRILDRPLELAATRESGTGSDRVEAPQVEGPRQHTR